MGCRVEGLDSSNAFTPPVVLSRKNCRGVKEPNSRLGVNTDCCPQLSRTVGGGKAHYGGEVKARGATLPMHSHPSGWEMDFVLESGCQLSWSDNFATDQCIQHMVRGERAHNGISSSIGKSQRNDKLSDGVTLV